MRLVGPPAIFLTNLKSNLKFKALCLMKINTGTSSNKKCIIQNPIRDLIEFCNLFRYFRLKLNRYLRNQRLGVWYFNSERFKSQLVSFGLLR